MADTTAPAAGDAPPTHAGDAPPTPAGDAPGTPRRTRSGAPVVIGVVVAVIVAQAVLAVLFGWPAARTAPHDLPIAVAGPPAVTAPVVSGLSAAHPGAFAISQAGDAGAARAAITDRRVYAAIVVDPGGVTVFTASAASPAVAQLLTQAIPTGIQAHAPGTPVRVQDLAPNPAGDPHGAVPATMLIPVVITSLVTGALLALLAGSALARLAGLVGVALLGAAGTTLVVHTWLGGLSGSCLTNTAVLSLIILAVAATTTGLAHQLHTPGIALAVITLFFFGFPFSGATSAPQLLPHPWGNLGQALPAGAGNTAIRSVAFFNNANTAHPLLILTLWAIGGIALLLLPPLSTARPAGDALAVIERNVS